MNAVKMLVVVGALCVTTGANSDSTSPDGRADVRYTLTIDMQVEGKSYAITRMGLCHFHVKSGAPATDIQSVEYWGDDLLAGAVSKILQNNQAVVVQLPNLCPGPNNVHSSSPLLDNLKNYSPALIWFPDIAHIDSFEMYPSFDAKTKKHVMVSGIRLEESNGDNPTLPENDREDHLAKRFGWRPLGGDGLPIIFRTNIAYVLPYSYWSEDKFLKNYFSNKTQLTYIDTRSGDPQATAIGMHHVRLLGLSSATTWGVSPIVPGHIDNRHGDYYEVPVVKKPDVWVLARDQRGVRVFMRDGVVGASSGHDKLTYKTVSVEYGIIFDPETKELISPSFLLISR